RHRGGALRFVQESHREEAQLVRATADLREGGAADLAARARTGHHAQGDPRVGAGEGGDAPTMANRLLARISRLFSFALERDWISANPAFRNKKAALTNW